MRSDASDNYVGIHQVTQAFGDELKMNGVVLMGHESERSVP